MLAKLIKWNALNPSWGKIVWLGEAFSQVETQPIFEPIGLGL